jgi:hypothetical protein
MRDRLIEVIKNSHCVDTWNHYTDDFKEPNPIEELADYLLANGVIVPPCKVGDTLYDISEFVEERDCPEMYEIKDNTLSIEKGKNGEYRFVYDCCYIYPEEIGKKMFYTEEEAIKMIEALRKDDGK